MNQKQTRPFGIKIIILLEAINGIVLIVTALGLRFIEGLRITPFLIGTDDYNFFLFVVGIPSIVIAFGLWRLRRWAWITVIIQTGIQLGIDIYFYSHGGTPFISMLVNIVTVFYLYQTDVKNAFKHGQVRRRSFLRAKSL